MQLGFPAQQSSFVVEQIQANPANRKDLSLLLCQAEDRYAELGASMQIAHSQLAATARRQWDGFIELERRVLAQLLELDSLRLDWASELLAVVDGQLEEELVAVAQERQVDHAVQVNDERLDAVPGDEV